MESNIEKITIYKDYYFFSHFDGTNNIFTDCNSNCIFLFRKLYGKVQRECSAANEGKWRKNKMLKIIFKNKLVNHIMSPLPPTPILQQCYCLLLQRDQKEKKIGKRGHFVIYQIY